MHFRYGVFDGHGDILFGDVRRCAGAAIAAVNMNNMCAGIVGTDRYHIHIIRCRDFDGNQRIGIHFLDPVNMLLVIFDGIDRVKREG